MTTRFYGCQPKLHTDRNAISAFDIGPQPRHLFFLLGGRLQAALYLDCHLWASDSTNHMIDSRECAYVYPHLSGTEQASVPGNSTVLPFCQRVQYALPSERQKNLCGVPATRSSLAVAARRRDLILSVRLDRLCL